MTSSAASSSGFIQTASSCSAARRVATPGPDSDIDLFIEMESDLRPIDRMVEVQRLFGLRLWGLDVFVYTPAEVEARRGRIGNLLSYVDAEGKVLYERPS